MGEENAVRRCDALLIVPRDRLDRRQAKHASTADARGSSGWLAAVESQYVCRTQLERAGLCGMVFNSESQPGRGPPRVGLVPIVRLTCRE